MLYELVLAVIVTSPVLVNLRAYKILSIPFNAHLQFVVAKIMAFTKRVAGGKDRFTWEEVKADKDRENYLGRLILK